MFGAQSSSPSLFGTPSLTPNPFGTPPTPFATPSSTPFATPASTPAFGTPSTPSFSTSAFGTSSLFSTPPFNPQQQQQQQSSGAFNFSTPFGQTTTTPPPQQQQSQLTPFGQSTNPFGNAQLTTQMAPVAPLPFSLADRDIQAIVDAYKEDPGNPKYAFKHLLFSVTEPQFRIKPTGVSDIMWAEAMGKLEGMESSNRERLWPHLVQGFKDLSQRLKLQDEVILSDAERLRMTQSNVKMVLSLSLSLSLHTCGAKQLIYDVQFHICALQLQRHFQADTLPWIERLRQKEQGLQRRLLRVDLLLLDVAHFASLLEHFYVFICCPKVMRIVEALEGKGCRMPLMKGEVELAEKLATITRQLKGSGAELSRRVQNLLTVARVQANGGGGGGSIYLPGSTKIHDQSLADMQEVSANLQYAVLEAGRESYAAIVLVVGNVLQQQTEAIARLGNVLKRDLRDTEIIMAEDTEMKEDAS
ncbi:hypothetical protein RHSIM_Rhsim12G0102200 [Rhododendron simsii]|uniref:Nucleoporin Nup54 alpha-helical domain-containing protein n=1 Tax=Rhododendron simsii TaxID=118357 RepID=A0A834G8W1_RHOSS|nr:hypothetical protein RHSIM_Rhsim12G0102200 [Rhododendron simsii]